MKHKLEHCKNCLWVKMGRGCKVFIDRKDPIINKNGMCNARITDKKKYKRLLEEMEEYKRHYNSLKKPENYTSSLSKKG